MNTYKKAVYRMDSDIKKLIPKPWRELEPATKLTVSIVLLILICIHFFRECWSRGVCGGI